MSRPLETFQIGEIQVALWGTRSDDGNRSKRVSIQKSRYNAEKKEYDRSSVYVHATELNCLINLLRRAERALVKRKKNEE